MKTVRCIDLEKYEMAEDKRVDGLPWWKKIFAARMQIVSEHDDKVIKVTTSPGKHLVQKFRPTDIGSSVFWVEEEHKSEVVVQCVDCGRKRVEYSPYTVETLKALKP